MWAQILKKKAYIVWVLLLLNNYSSTPWETLEKRQHDRNEDQPKSDDDHTAVTALYCKSFLPLPLLPSDIVNLFPESPATLL